MKFLDGFFPNVIEIDSFGRRRQPSTDCVYEPTILFTGGRSSAHSTCLSKDENKYLPNVAGHWKTNLDRVETAGRWISVFEAIEIDNFHLRWQRFSNCGTTWQFVATSGKVSQLHFPFFLMTLTNPTCSWRTSKNIVQRRHCDWLVYSGNLIKSGEKVKWRWIRQTSSAVPLKKFTPTKKIY